MRGGHYVAYVHVRDQQNKVPVAVKDCDRKLGDVDVQPEKEDIGIAPSDVTTDNERTLDAGPNTQLPCTKETDPVKTGDGVGEGCDDLCRVGQWYHVSDSHVRVATEAEVMKSQAYLLFYERFPLLRQRNS